jgi:hypothetical protein
MDKAVLRARLVVGGKREKHQAGSATGALRTSGTALSSFLV